MSKDTTKSYRLLGDRGGRAYLLKIGRNGDLLVYDELTGLNKAIRHSPNERSQYIDEQSDYAIVQPIIFESGYLELNSKTDAQTIVFLDLHPDNKENGGTIFELVNEEAEAIEETKYEDAVLDVKQAVREKEREENGIYALESLVAVLKGSIAGVDQMSKDELKREIYGYINEDPYRFITNGKVNIFNDDNTNRKYIVLRAISDGVISVSLNNRAITWGRNKEVITNVPMGVRPVDHFTDFLSTEDGVLVLDEILNRS